MANKMARYNGMTNNELRRVREAAQRLFEDWDESDMDGPRPDPSKIKTASDFLAMMRDNAWDLEETLGSIAGAELDNVDKSSTENGSYQNYHERVVAQLVYYYGCKPEDFYNFDT